MEGLASKHDTCWIHVYVGYMYIWLANMIHVMIHVYYMHIYIRDTTRVCPV